MKLVKLIQMLESFRDQADDPRNIDIVFLDVHDDRLGISRIIYAFHDRRVEIDLGPELPSEQNQDELTAQK